MATATLKVNAYKGTNKRESLITKFMNSYMNLPERDRASIICGLLAMNGSTNTYPLYKAFTE